MVHLGKQKVLLAGAAGILVIGGVVALSINDSHPSRLDPAPQSGSASKVHSSGTKTTSGLSSAPASNTAPIPSSAPTSAVSDDSWGSDWVISGTDTLYISTNGASYHEVNPPLPKGARLASAVVSGSTVIAYGYNPQLLLGQPIVLDVSHDGGVTWNVERFAVYGNPTNIHFIVARGSVIGMMADTIAPGADATGGEWFQTNNDGNSWTNPFPNTSPSNTPQGGPVTLVGSDLWVLGGGQGYDQLWLSTNDGVSWSQVHFPGESVDDAPSHGCQGSVYPGIAGALPSGATVLVEARVPNGACTSNYLDVTAYTTTNQGATWTAFGSYTTTEVGEYPGLLPRYLTVQGNSVWLATIANQFVTNPPPEPPRLVRITTSDSAGLISLPSTKTTVEQFTEPSITINAIGQLQATLIQYPPLNAPPDTPSIISGRYVSANDGGTWQLLPLYFVANGSPVAK